MRKPEKVPTGPYIGCHSDVKESSQRHIGDLVDIVGTEVQGRITDIYTMAARKKKSQWPYVRDVLVVEGFGEVFARDTILGQGHPRTQLWM